MPKLTRRGPNLPHSWRSQTDKGLWPSDTSAAILIGAISGDSVHRKSTGVASSFARQDKGENKHIQIDQRS